MPYGGAIQDDYYHWCCWGGILSCRALAGVGVGRCNRTRGFAQHSQGQDSHCQQGGIQTVLSCSLLDLSRDGGVGVGGWWLLPGWMGSRRDQPLNLVG